MDQIDTIRKGIHHKYTCASSFGYSCDCGACEALAVLDQLEQERQWIPVSERLPEVNVLGAYGSDWVIGCYMFDGGSEIDLVKYIKTSNNSWWRTIGENEIPITHWMPLPAPPKENDDE